MSLEELRVDLACALRGAARMGMHEGVDNHFSVAVPGEDGVARGDRFLRALYKQEPGYRQ